MQLRGPQIAKPHVLHGADHTDYYKPTDALRETFSRRNAMVNTVLLTTQLETLFGVECSAGDVIAAIAFHSATTAFTPGTNQYFAFRDSSYNKLALTADDGALAWGANTQKKLYISRTVTDAVATSGSAVITSATAAFTQTDVGKNVTFMGAGAAGAPLGGGVTRTTAGVVNAGVTILSVQSATSATLSANAGTSVASAGTAYIATPYTVLNDGLFYVACMVKGTVPSFLTFTLPGSGYTDVVPPIIAGQDGSHTGLTTPATAPTTSATPSAFGGTAYAYVASS